MLSDDICQYLGRRLQSQIEHLQITVSHPHFFIPAWIGFRQLKTLDVQIESANSFVSVLATVQKCRNSLERLFLCCVRADRASTSNLFKRWFQTLDLSEPYLPKLQQFGLSNIDLTAISDHILAFTNIFALSRLALPLCRGMDHFFAQLEPRAKKECLKLVGISLSDLTRGHGLVEEPAFANVLSACDAIEAFHLAGTDAHAFPSATLVSVIARLGRTLRSLSIGYTLSESRRTVDSVQLNSICEACPALQQIGFRVEEVDIIEWSDTFWVSDRCASGPRMSQLIVKREACVISPNCTSCISN